MPVTAWVAWRDHQALSSSRSRLLPPRSLPGARGDRFGTLWSEQVVHPLGSGPAERGAHVRVRAERQADLAMASVSMTTRVATPWVRRSVAQAWRRSWNRWWGSPAVFSSVWNRRVTVMPSSGVPIVETKARSRGSSCQRAPAPSRSSSWLDTVFVREGGVFSCLPLIGRLARRAGRERLTKSSPYPRRPPCPTVLGAAPLVSAGTWRYRCTPSICPSCCPR